MNNLARTASGVLTLLCVLASPVAGADTDLGPVFTESEKRILEEYAKQHQPDPGNSSGNKKGGKKGSAGHKSLPPGIAKNLQRGKPLPPGIAKHTLPEDLESRLPQRKGYERVIVDGRIILIEQATGVVRDVLEGVLFPD
jgi:Ni/Co efflux regulator RcnB